MSSVKISNEGLEWTTELSLQLIDEYEKFPLLWDAKDPNHFSRNKKADAWEVISLNVRVDVHQCIQKMNSLLGSFRREKKKGKKSIGTGKARKEIYISKWYAFERMHYLLDKDEPRRTIDTGEEVHEEQELDSDQNSSNLDPEQNPVHESDQNPNQDESAVVATKPFTPLRENKRKKASDNKDDARLEEAFKILRETASKTEIPPDSSAIYSQYIATKLRCYSSISRAQVENAINNILFQADMGKYDNPPHMSFSQYYQNAAHISQYPVTQLPGNYQCVPVPLPSPSPSDESSTSSTSNCPTSPVSNYHMRDTESQNL